MSNQAHNGGQWALPKHHVDNKIGLKLRWEPEGPSLFLSVRPLPTPQTWIPLRSLRCQGYSEEGPKLECDRPITTPWLPQLFPLYHKDFPYRSYQLREERLPNSQDYGCKGVRVKGFPFVYVLANAR